MKRMSATITLKELRTNPRHYVDLLNLGYAVNLTDHGKLLAIAESPTPSKRAKKHKPGTVGAFLEYMEEIKKDPPPQVLDPNLDTVEAIKKLRYERYLEKQRRIDNQ